MRHPRISPASRARGSLAALTAAVALACAASPAAAAVPGNFWGVDPQAAPTPEQFQRLRTGGVDSVRIPVEWAAIQASPGGPLDWGTTDELVGGAATAGLEVLPFVTGAPSWAVPYAVVNRQAHSEAPRNLPVRTGQQRAEWIWFLEQVVERYGPNGAFWTANPGVPYRPVGTWQLWNEENFKYFVARPNPAEYGKLIKISYPVIKRFDPSARILLGGMFSAPKEARYRRKPKQAYFATDFLNRLYKTTPGVRSEFDGVALHPYTYNWQELSAHVEDLRDVLRRNHDARKGIWITELGWSSDRPSASNGFNKFEKGPGGQAAQLKGAFKLFVRNQRKWRLQQVYWFSVDDHPGACNFCDGSGLFGPGFVPKPAWSAYTRFAGGRAG